jgi:hypothetical protein
MKYKAFILVIAILLPIITAACADKSSDSTANDTEAAATTTESETTVDPAYVSDLPQRDLGGLTITFLTPNSENNSDWSVWTPRDIYAEAENGETINDAVYRRNSTVEELYNVTIANDDSTDSLTRLQKAVTADDPIYDVVQMRFNTVTTPVTGGMLLDVKKLTYIDLDKKYWNLEASKAMTLANHMFLFNGDIMLLDKDSSGVLIFNKQMQTDFSLPNLYDMVKGYTWTLDSFYGTIKGVTNDIDGDGELTYKDRWGFVGYRDTLPAMLVSAGGLIATKDADDLPVITITDEKNLAIIDKIYMVMYDNANTFNLQKLYAQGFSDTIFTEARSMFTENRLLYYWVRLREVETFRGMETDFGILPMPTYDESQKQYYTALNSYVGTTMAAVTTCRYPEELSIVLESLAEQSHKLLIPAYYDINLTSKVARDTESEAMLDIIISTGVVDIGAVYDFGGICSQFMEMSLTDNRDIVSKVKSLQKAADAAIKRLVKNIEKVDG